MKRIILAAATTALLATAVSGVGGSAVDTVSPVSSAAGNTVTPAAAPVGAQVAAITTEFDWPAGYPVPVLRKFRVGQHNWQPGHRGVDLALAAGDAVYAAGAGEVIYAGQLNDRELVSIAHPGGIRTTYEPVQPTVSRGEMVQLGQKIGVVAAGHCTPFSCLHWGAKRGTKNYLDPLSLLPDQQIRLLE
ncbi:MAG: M23 family metallopeptidase [Trueperella sp.]|nr:M23 family metallopeptidase [Trueperella sp.]